MMTPVENARRTARLLLDEELVSGRLTEIEATAPSVIAALLQPVSIVRRQRLTATLGLRFRLVEGIAASISQAQSVREAALGSEAGGEPRFLVRVDEFPMASASDPDRIGLDSFRRFHRAMSGLDGKYLLAVVPELADSYLDPSASGTRVLTDAEVDLLRDLGSEGVVFGQHGTTHRSRRRSPSRRSEFIGLPASALEALLDSGRARLATADIHPRVLVPPFNRFDARQWEVLAGRYRVIAGGPESVLIVGALPSPSWRQGAVYVPCYPPLYGRASLITRAVRKIIELRPGTCVPIVLHPSWEHEDGFRAVEELISVIGQRACSWDDFIAAADRSAGPSGSLDEQG